jgi:hypothetical protein
MQTFSELIIVVRYHLQQHLPLRNTDLARDTVFGLFTVIFLFLIVRAFSNSSKYIDCPPLLIDMQQEIRLYVVQLVQRAVKAGGIAPPLAPALTTLRRDPRSAFSYETTNALNQLPHEERTAFLDSLDNYLDTLNRRYGELEGVNLAREF